MFILFGNWRFGYVGFFEDFYFSRVVWARGREVFILRFRFSDTLVFVEVNE